MCCPAPGHRLTFRGEHHARFPHRPAACFVNPECQTLASERARDISNPADLSHVGGIALGDAADVEALVAAANAAQRSWRQVDAKSRAALLHQLANAIETGQATQREVARLMTLEMGKPFPEAMGDRPTARRSSATTPRWPVTTPARSPAPRRSAPSSTCATSPTA